MICRLLYFISFYLIVNGATPNWNNVKVRLELRSGASDMENQPCTLSNGQNGECVIYYLCNEKGEINTDGSTILDSRFGSEALNCTRNDYVCCGIPASSQTQSNIKNPPRVNIDSTTASTATSAATPPKATSATPIPNKCGYRSFSDTSANNDKEAKFGEFPWMVAVLMDAPNEEGGFKYICGGSLIHPSVILTAAHCVETPNEAKKYIIRAGEWDTKSVKEKIPYQQKKISSIVLHDDYYKGALFHDLALLFLEEPVNLGVENVAVVCLPLEGESDPVNVRCLSSGWGKENYGKAGKYSTILKKVELPIIEKTACQTALRNTRLGLKFQLHSSFTCAGGEGLDVCSGDGGSPLVCSMPLNNVERFVQYGIVSWGIGCGENGIPGVFAQTASHRVWIDDQLYSKSLTPYPS